MTIEGRLNDLNLILPKLSSKNIGLYSSVLILKEQHLVFVSGQLPKIDDQKIITGKIHSAGQIEFGQNAAKQAILTTLSILKNELGSLDYIKRFIQITGYVNCDNDFNMEHKVLDGASMIINRILPEESLPTRIAIGVCSLPLNATIEISSIVELL